MDISSLDNQNEFMDTIWLISGGNTPKMYWHFYKKIDDETN